jgi:microcystin-dependent protein
MSQISRMDVQFSPFPLGFCPDSLNDLGSALAARLIVTPGLGFNGINIGPVAPENTDLPWFNTTANDWYYYSTVAGEWLPVNPVAVTGQVEIGTVTFWDGQISLINSFWGDRWLFADGSAVSRLAYPDYFGLVGVKWGAGDGVTTFNILNLTNNFAVGADADTAGQATTTVGDGVTAAIERAYLDHRHNFINDGGPNNLTNGSPGNSYTIRGATTDAAGSVTPLRVLPPYKALVPLVRVK